jgi:hypothetical protein
VLQRAQFASEGCRLAWHQFEGFRDLVTLLFSRAVNGINLRGVLAGLAFLPVQSLTRPDQTLGHRLDQVGALPITPVGEQGPQRHLPGHPSARPGTAAPGTGSFRPVFIGLDGREKPVAAKTMSCAVGASALNAVLPALGGAVNDGRGLAVLDLGCQALSGQDLLKIHALGHVDHVPVMEVSQLHGVPLHIVPGRFTDAADMVGVDGSLVPVHMENRVP